uniref:Uncharacterized protein n=1 Tax=Taeniopygia guttata TaxID=59729 RepID=A0A674GJ02_TAEGU
MECSNSGALSLVSSTVTMTGTSPDFGGFPPSLAVSRSLGCSAHRRPDFVSTKKRDSRYSSLRCKSREKCSLGLSV